MKKLCKVFVAGFMALALAFSFTPALAAECNPSDGVGGGAACGRQGSEGDATNCLFKGGSCSDGIITSIINVILFITGVLSVAMLIYGGIRYTTSAGEAARVTGAKNTVMYAIIGLIISILAYAIVNFVIGNLVNPGS
jgi:hypothetical protein